MSNENAKPLTKEEVPLGYTYEQVVATVARMTELETALREELRTYEESCLDLEADPEDEPMVAQYRKLKTVLDGTSPSSFSGRVLTPEQVAKVREILDRIRVRVGTSGIESEWAAEALALLDGAGK